MNILNILSSAKGNKSLSTQLSEEIVRKIQEKHPETSLIVKDLVSFNVPHLDETYLHAFQSDPENLGMHHKEAIKFSNSSIDELKAADVIVIAVAVYNFNIPSCLKAWIDQIVQAHKTFEYRNSQPVGLLQNTKTYLAISSGGIYSSGKGKEIDFVEPYLRYILEFIGITDVTTFRIEGTAILEYEDNAVKKGLSSVII